MRRVPFHLIGAATLVAAVVLPGCERGSDMWDQDKYDPLQASDVFDNGASARSPVPGTVSRDDWTDDEAGNTGMVDGRFVARVPTDITAQLLARGQERFDIYCTPCHGYDGAGKGMVIQRGYTAPPSFHIDRLRGVPDGYLFQVITNGLGRMPSYGAQVRERDRWAIIAYVRALQFSRHAEVASLPEGTRRDLEGQR